ncbi:MAG: sulfotransferase [Cyanobacteria bacterium P01_H01_bin.105]
MTANNSKPASSPITSAVAQRTPTFVIIGVQKAGTTSIYNYLNQHPQVYMSPVKETDFFNKDWENLPADVQSRKKNGIVTWDRYTQLFARATDEHIALGEVSPNYMLNYLTSAKQIQQRLPNAKLIAVLRDPVERACSNYLMNMRDATGKQTSLAEQVRSRGSSSYVLLKGKYYESLKYFFEVCGRHRVDVFFYDDLRQNSQRFMQSLYQSIGVNPDFDVNTSKKAQTAKVPKNQALNRLLKTQNPVRSVATGIMQIVPKELRHQLRERLITLNSQDKQKAKFTEEDIILLRQYYREDILQLQDLLQHDLSAWLKE